MSERPAKRAKAAEQPEEVPTSEDAWLFRSTKKLSDAEVLACMQLHGSCPVLRLDASKWRAKDGVAGPIFALGGKGADSSGEQLMDLLRPHCRQSGCIVLEGVSEAAVAPACGLVQCIEATFEEEGPEEAQVFVVLEAYATSHLEADSVWGQGEHANYVLADAEAPLAAPAGATPSSMATLLGIVEGALESHGAPADRDTAKVGETVMVTKENELEDCEWDPTAYQAEEAAAEAALTPAEREKKEDAKTAAQIAKEIRDWDEENYMQYHHIGGGRKKLVNMNKFRR